MIEDKIYNLLKKVGTPYEMFFKGTHYYKGCFMPVYYIFPHLPRFPLPTENPADSWDYGMQNILSQAYEIKREDVKPGDVLVTKFKNELHVALVIDPFRIIHVFRDHTLQISRINMFKSRLVKFFRVK